MADEFTGFIACCDAQNPNDPKAKVLFKERENFYDPLLNKHCATNWHTIKKEDVEELQIWWHGKKKGFFLKKDFPDFQEWIFYHTGCVEKGRTKTLSRTIGVQAAETHKITVSEESGEITLH